MESRCGVILGDKGYLLKVEPLGIRVDDLKYQESLLLHFPKISLQKYWWEIIYKIIKSSRTSETNQFKLVKSYRRFIVQLVLPRLIEYTEN